MRRKRKEEETNQLRRGKNLREEVVANSSFGKGLKEGGDEIGETQLEGEMTNSSRNFWVCVWFGLCFG